MHFGFYPNHSFGCSHVQNCPHLGGASLSAVVDAANEQDDWLDSLLATIDKQRRTISDLIDQNQQLQHQLEQAKLELKLERQNKFADNSQDEQEELPPDAEDQDSNPSDPAAKPKKKRGAPVGHPGWFRPTPTEYDWEVEAPAPSRCPHCQGAVTVYGDLEADEHLQEDILDGVYRVVLYRHLVASCNACGEWVQQAGEGEILGSRIGPQLRSTAIYLRNVIGISYRKVPQAIEEMFGVTFTPAALIGFETMLADKAAPIVDDIGKKLSSSDGAVHADETFSTLNGKRAYFWVHADGKFVHFQFATTRSGRISRNVLGDDFTGVLVTDCYSGYAASSAGAKQKCLAHLARRAHEWQKLTEEGSADYAFFEDVKQFVKRGCEFARLRGEGKLTAEEQAARSQWLRDELARLEKCKLSHEKALTLQARIVRHHDEWLVFVEDSRVPPTNNLAERALRPLVLLRKITFGHRSESGGKRMGTILTVGETARRHGHRASELFYYLFTRPPDVVLRRLYASPH